MAETNDAYLLAHPEEDAPHRRGDEVSIVRVIGAVARDYNTSVVDIIERMSWCLFMALVDDLCERLEAEKAERNKIERESRRSGMRHRTQTR